MPDRNAPSASNADDHPGTTAILACIRDGGDVQGRAALRVAESLDSTSQYLRDHEAQEIWTDVELFLMDHPVEVATGASVAGFAVARMLI